MDAPRLIRRQVHYLVVLVSVFLAGMAQAQETITIGINLPLSGARKEAGKNVKAGVELIREQVNAAGGVKIGGQSYTLQYVYGDNESEPQKAVSAALKLITVDKVVAIVGPIDSSRAIPAGNICNSFKTPMVSPTSTNPKTTLNRPFVFRACFLDNFQGEVMADFAITELKAEKAAVLFNVADAYPRGLAEFFKKSFEKQRGPGSVVAFEKFLSSEKDYSHYFEKIVASDADVLFIPQYSDEIPAIIKQARKNGWKKAIFGGDAWESSDLMAECGDVCKGLYFCSHFGAVGAKGKAKTFVEQFEKKNGRLPTANAALSYDSVDLVLTAISHLDSLGSNLLDTRRAIKDKLAAIRSFEGVSGSLDMNSTGDPTKSAVVLKINDKGEFESYKILNP